MATESANSTKTTAWGALAVRKTTEERVDALRSDYMRLHGADISDDQVVQALLKGRTVEDLPTPDEIKASISAR